MKALKKFSKKQKSAIRLLLQIPQQYCTPDTFHTLRLAIKKLHAVFDLTHFCAQKFKQKKTFRPYTLIFRQAGKIRELQVEAALLEKHFFFNLPKEYSADLKKTLTTELEKFHFVTKCKLNPALEKNYQKIIPLLTKISKKKAQRYMDKKRVEIEKLLRQKTLKSKQIHQLRKQLKEFQYNESCLNYDQQSELISNKNVLPELLGEWHDYQVTVTHLKKAINSGATTTNENNQLENIKTLFMLKRQLLHKKIKATLANPL
ncbi:CHAD domain-containing protein [Flavobacterium sp. ZS1P14]|uniref:CHAD domain-containing protein n=1 Tax=Flavobacterium sp. ZS1P14 TaxID=3401729 RepID=UPI003AAADEA3